MAKVRLCIYCNKINGEVNICDVCQICGGYVNKTDLDKNNIENYNKKHEKWLKTHKIYKKVLTNSET